MNKNNKLDNFVNQATQNITDDRAATKTLLMSLMKYMTTGDDRHREFGMIAAKYLETLQRSNEQLVKLASLMQKRENIEDHISEEDKQEIFDMIKQTEESLK